MDNNQNHTIQQPQAPQTAPEQFIPAPEGAPVRPEPPVKKSINPLSVAGFILSFYSPIVGLILSIISLVQLKTYPEGGKSLSVAGVVISAVSILLTIIMIIAVIMFYAWLFDYAIQHGGIQTFTY